ncbi:unnamed protein product [Rodentolepis nana]|uniref:Non-specific serine/threonine protein kinase n=1 Tax=Rodentolepis nana TaxID=102285 RepID=A0A0R3T1D3_RODNA|nr:unnamed protein product [Rodentolepis nana]
MKVLHKARFLLFESNTVNTPFTSLANEEDITKTEYNGFFGAKQLSPSAVLAQSMAKIRVDLPRTSLIEPQAATKISLVCEALLKAMLPDTKKFLLPILTCYVKKQPQEVEKGLLILNQYKKLGDLHMWERGLRHLQYYLQPVRLFHLALGTYDLELAESLAERSQLDPKEYLPVLAQLRAITTQSNGDAKSNTSYQHARIDLLLKRYSSALRGLYLAGPEHWGEFCDVVENQKLFSEALDLLQQGTPQFSEIANRWAETLVASQRLVAAGEVHLRAGHYASAAQLFVTTRSVQLWRLTVDRGIGETKQAENAEFLSLEVISTQARKLADDLKWLGRYLEAASLYSDYLKDYMNAACTAAEGGHWLEAHSWAEHANNKAEVNAKIKEISLKAYSDFVSSLTQNSEEFRQSFDRLLEVRAELKEKALNAAAGFGDEVYDDTESELFSDTGSVVSGFSSSSRSSQYSKTSGRSRKNCRKRDRKKWSTKKGSKYEEVALIQILHTNITACQRLFEGVAELVKELWRHCLSEEATKLARQANSLLLIQRASLSIVWCNKITGEWRRFYSFRQL